MSKLDPATAGKLEFRSPARMILVLAKYTRKSISCHLNPGFQQQTRWRIFNQKALDKIALRFYHASRLSNWSLIQINSNFFGGHEHEHS
jgi:hypothetical protein